MDWSYIQRLCSGGVIPPYSRRTCVFNTGLPPWEEALKISFCPPCMQKPWSHVYPLVNNKLPWTGGSLRLMLPLWGDHINNQINYQQKQWLHIALHSLVPQWFGIQTLIFRDNLVYWGYEIGSVVWGINHWNAFVIFFAVLRPLVGLKKYLVLTRG